MGDQPAGAMGYDGDDQPELRGYVYVFYNIYIYDMYNICSGIYIYWDIWIIIVKIGMGMIPHDLPGRKG